jgi:hypothetical protein
VKIAHADFRIDGPVDSCRALTRPIAILCLGWSPSNWAGHSNTHDLGAHRLVAQGRRPSDTGGHLLIESDRRLRC